MDKRYQVFVSSTYADLKEERSHVIQALMEMDCIPAGMELFPALDEEQFEFIKKVIDDCDYYLLIIGGRYGSITEDGVSYTEKEFDYAVRKGLKVIALVHEKPEDLPAKKTEQNPEARKKLDAFRNKVMKGRLVRFWKNPNELAGLVALNLQKTIKMYPAIGWVRGDKAADNAELLKQINELRNENNKLLETNKKLTKQRVTRSNVAFDNDKVLVSGKVWSNPFNLEGFPTVHWNENISWINIFKCFGFELIERQISEYEIFNIISTSLGVKHITRKVEYEASLDEDCFLTIRNQFLALGYVKITRDSNDMLSWKITEKGITKLTQTVAIRKK